MNTPIRCDLCVAKADAKPESLSDVLCYTAPPIALLSWLDKAMQAQGDKTPAAIREWREKWRKLNAGDPMPEIDRFDIPVQAALVKEPVQYA
jgi:hypothetical protein